MKHIEIHVGKTTTGQHKAYLPKSTYAKQGESPVLPKHIKDHDVEAQSDEWIDWGRSNNYPQKVEKKLKQTTVALPIIGKHVGLMYGEGIYYYKKSYNSKGEELRTKLVIPAIEEFLKMTNTPYQLQGSIFDFKRLFNCFTSIMLSNDKKKVVQLVHRPAKFCRLAKPNTRGEINHIYTAADFPAPEKAEKIRAVNKYDPWGSIANLNGSRELIMHHCYNTGDQYYATPFHHGLFEEDGWLDVAINTPLCIRQMQKNLIKVAYIIRIPITYFQNRYKDWDGLNQDEQLKLIDDKIDEMNDSLSGTDNVYKSIADVYGVNDLGEAELKIEIEAVDDKTKSDHWMPSSDAADKQTAYALLMHPSMIGMHEGGKIGEGSGSNQREAFNGVTDTNTIEQMTILAPYYFASMVNGWDVEWAFEHTRHVTTDISKTGQAKDDD